MVWDSAGHPSHRHYSAQNLGNRQNSGPGSNGVKSTKRQVGNLCARCPPCPEQDFFSSVGSNEGNRWFPRRLMSATFHGPAMPGLLHSLIASWLVWGKMRKTIARGADLRLAKLRDLVSLIYKFSNCSNQRNPFHCSPPVFTSIPASSSRGWDS